VARVLRMPEVSDDPSVATLTEWLVAESAGFASAQSIATVETEKLLVSVEVAEPGVLLKRLVEPGERIEVGTPLAVLGDPGEFVTDIDGLLVRLGLAEAPAPTLPPPARRAASEPVREPTPQPPEQQAPPVRAGETPRPRHLGHSAAGGVPEPEEEPELPRPLVYAWAPRGLHDDGEHDVSAALLPPSPWSDPEPSRLAALEAIAASAGSPSGGPSASAQDQSAATVHPLGELTQVHLRATVRAESLLAVCDEVDELTVTDLVVKAVAGALLRVPQLAGGRTTADIAVAVPTHHGIATPVVRDVGSLTATAVAATLRARTDRANTTGGLTDEVGSAAITIADLGRYGMDELSVDVTPARRAVLGVGAVREEPVVEDGVLVPGSVMTMTLSVDESLADAAVAAEWFGVLTELLEHPLRFLA
jgi:pyruvate dehydrogenase E2 component (dihydrolipoamide acetyltransferase)